MLVVVVGRTRDSEKYSGNGWEGEQADKAVLARKHRDVKRD